MKKLFVLIFGIFLGMVAPVLSQENGEKIIIRCADGVDFLRFVSPQNVQPLAKVLTDQGCFGSPPPPLLFDNNFLRNSQQMQLLEDLQKVEDLRMQMEQQIQRLERQSRDSQFPLSVKREK